MPWAGFFFPSKNAIITLPMAPSPAPRGAGLIRENLEKVLERVEKARLRAGRNKEKIRLVAVTKTVPAERILEAIRCGVREIGESRVQETQDKFLSMQGRAKQFGRPTGLSGAEGLIWHMIGRLQTNKVNRAVEFFDMIQSVDSLKLAQAIDRRAGRTQKVQDCLVELKVSEETAKIGLEEGALESFMEQCAALKSVRLLGLMTIAPYFDDPEGARPYFAKARGLFEKFFPNPGSILSMGMSGDFEAAIEEGSTLVRVGAAIFGERT